MLSMVGRYAGRGQFVGQDQDIGVRLTNDGADRSSAPITCALGTPTGAPETLYCNRARFLDFAQHDSTITDDAIAL